MRTYRHPNPGARRVQSNELHRRQRRRERAAVIEAYGGKCACCGETQYEFLSIDHVAGGGRKHRASLTMSMEHFLYKNGFPAGYRLLCHNCNQAIGYYGRCPHGLTRGEPEPVREAQLALI